MHYLALKVCLDGVHAQQHTLEVSRRLSQIFTCQSQNLTCLLVRDALKLTAHNVPDKTYC